MKWPAGKTEPATFRQCKALAAACNERWLRETGVKDSLLFKTILEKAIKEKNEGKLTKNECSSLISVANHGGTQLELDWLIERIGYPNAEETDKRKSSLLSRKKADKNKNKGSTKVSVDKNIPPPSNGQGSPSKVSIDKDIPFPPDAVVVHLPQDAPITITSDDRHAARQEKVKQVDTKTGKFKDVELKKAHAILAKRLGITPEEFARQLSQAEKDAKKIEEDLKEEAMIAADRAKNIISNADVIHGDILRVNKVLEISGIGGTGQLYRLIQNNMFPVQVKLDEEIFGKNSVGWIKSEVIEWVKNRDSQIYDVTIDNNVPIPFDDKPRSASKNAKKRKLSRWPTENIKVGESFFVPRHANGKAQQIGVGAFRDKFPRRKIISRSVNENFVSGTRYWRIK